MHNFYAVIIELVEVPARLVMYPTIGRAHGRFIVQSIPRIGRVAPVRLATAIFSLGRLRPSIFPFSPPDGGSPPRERKRSLCVLFTGERTPQPP